MNLLRNQLQSVKHSFNFSEVTLTVTNNDTACHLFWSDHSVFRWPSPPKWKTFAIKSFSLCSLIMEGAILKPILRERNCTITKANGRYGPRHFGRLSVVWACRSRRSRLSSFGQHSSNAQNRCAKVWYLETPSNAGWSRNNVFLKKFKTLIKADAGKCILGGKNATCCLILKPLHPQSFPTAGTYWQPGQMPESTVVFLP